METIIGLDIGTYNIKAVSVEKSKTNILLRKYVVSASNGLYDKIISGSADENAQAVAFIKHFIKEHALNTDKVVATIPENKEFSKVITMPYIDGKGFRRAVEWESEQHLPQALSEVYLKYTILHKQGIDSNDAGRELLEKYLPSLSSKFMKEGEHPTALADILIVAVNRNLVERYLDVFSSAGLDTIGLEPVSISTIRSTIIESSDVSTLILNWGYNSIDFYLSVGNKLRFVRTVNMGVGNFNRVLAQQLDISATQANEYLYTYGFKEKELNGKIKEIIMPVVALILEEYRKSEKYIIKKSFLKDKEDRIKRIILTGGGALIPDVMLYLVGEVLPEVQLAKVWKKFDLSGVDTTDPRLELLGPMFAAAAGAALKED